MSDNVSANVVGVGLGTLFRFWSYRTLVFAPPPADEDEGPEALLSSAQRAA